MLGHWDVGSVLTLPLMQRVSMVHLLYCRFPSKVEIKSLRLWGNLEIGFLIFPADLGSQVLSSKLITRLGVLRCVGEHDLSHPALLSAGRLRIRGSAGSIKHCYFQVAFPPMASNQCVSSPKRAAIR